VGGIGATLAKVRIAAAAAAGTSGREAAHSTGFHINRVDSPSYSVLSPAGFAEEKEPIAPPVVNDGLSGQRRSRGSASPAVCTWFHRLSSRIHRKS